MSPPSVRHSRTYDYDADGQRYLQTKGFDFVPAGMVQWSLGLALRAETNRSAIRHGETMPSGLRQRH